MEQSKGLSMFELEQQTVHVEILGQLGPVARGNMGKDVTDERAQEVAQAIPDFLTTVSEDEPETCMDDRKCAQLLSGEAPRPRKKMAGGNLQTFFAAQRLVGGFHLKTINNELPDATVQEKKQQYQDAVLMRALRKRDGAHTTDTAEGDSSGCGAGDKEPQSISLIAESAQMDGDPVATFTAAFMRIPFDVKLHSEVIVPQSKGYLEELKRDGWVGRDLLNIVENPKPYDKVEEDLGKDAVEVLIDEHDPELFVVTQQDETLNRDEFIDKFGAKVLWIDESAIWKGAHEQASDESEALKLYQSAMTFQIATGLTLGSPILRAAIIKRTA